MSDEVTKLTLVLGDNMAGTSARRNAAYTLGQIGHARAVDVLCNALGDWDTDVRQIAASALGEIGDARAVDALCKALGDWDHDLYYTVRPACASALVKIGAPSVEALCKKLGWGHDSERRIVVSALGRIGAPAIKALCKALDDKNTPTRQDAAFALSSATKVGDTSALEPCCKALGDTDSEVRRLVADTLGCIGDARAVDALSKALGDTDNNVRLRVVFSLGQVGPPAIAALCKALRDTDKDVRHYAATALVKIGDACTVDALCRVLLDPSAYARQSGVFALGEIGDVRAIDALCEALGDEDSDVRRLADISLVNIGPPAVEALCKALGGKDRDLRKNIATVLRRIGNPEVLPSRIFIDSQMHMRLKSSALNVLSSKGEYYQDGRFHRYNTPNARQACKLMAQNDDPVISKAVDEMRRYLDNEFIIPAQRDEPKEREELPRAVSSEQLIDAGDKLLRGAEPPPLPPPKAPGIWKRLRLPSTGK